MVGQGTVYGASRWCCGTNGVGASRAFADRFLAAAGRRLHLCPARTGGIAIVIDRLEPSDGLLTKAQVSVNKDEILSARTVITPTTFSAAASEAGLCALKLIANAVDRSLCTGLSRRFQIAPAAQPANLVVRAFITRIIPTDEIAAAASSVTSVGMTVVKAAGVVTAPIPSLRFPIGLGGLALEAEALDRTGSQKAAIIWARGADLQSPAGIQGRRRLRVRVGLRRRFQQAPGHRRQPVQDLAFVADHGWDQLGAWRGSQGKSACEAFGRGPGVPGLMGGALGLPPELTDKGAPESREDGELNR